MGDWRHFGERLDPGPVAGGCGTMSDGRSSFADGPRVRHQSIPRPAADDKAVPDALARLVEAEILPRLMLAHRPAGRRAQADRAPSPDEIAAFSALLLAPGRSTSTARSPPCARAGCPCRACSSTCSPRRRATSASSGRTMSATSSP